MASRDIYHGFLANYFAVAKVYPHVPLFELGRGEYVIVVREGCYYTEALGYEQVI